MNQLEKINALCSRNNLGQIKKINPLEKNSDRTLFVLTEKGRYVFSFYEPGPRFRSGSELKAQAELLEKLKNNKFPVPRIFTLESIEKSNIVIREFINGRAKNAPSKAEVSQFATLLGRFHKTILNFKTKNKLQHHWDLKTTQKHLKEVVSEFPNDPFLKKLKTELDKIKIQNDLPSGTIHEDLGHRHVLWDKNKIVGLIDFERSYYAPLLYDLGQVLRGWCFHTNWTAWCNKKLTNILTHYSKIRPLTTDEKNNLYATIQFAVLERSFSFYLKFLFDKNQDAKKFALHSLNYLIPLLEKKKEKIQSIINPSVHEQRGNAA